MKPYTQCLPDNFTIQLLPLSESPSNLEGPFTVATTSAACKPNMSHFNTPLQSTSNIGRAIKCRAEPSALILHLCAVRLIMKVTLS